MRPRGANLAASSRNTVASKTGVIVIGSGIGGLCCAGLLARSGKEGVVLEAHSKPGGAAH